MRGLSARASELADKLRLATRQALTNLVDHALRQQVDFLLIAGDLYDGDWRDYQTGIFLVKQLQRLHAADIPVFLIHGNHDAQNLMTRQLDLPANVTVFSSRQAESHHLQELGVALHGWSYREQKETENPVPGYPEPIPGAFNIGLLHTGLGGLGGHADYAPCSLEELCNKGYDYWALGHVHGAQILHEHPHIVFSGNLQGRSIRETGPKSAYEVTVSQGRVTDLHPVYCDVARWADQELDVSECQDFDEVLTALRQQIQTIAHGQAEHLLALRLTLTGTTTLHDQLLAHAPRLTSEAHTSAAATSQTLYIDKVKPATQPSWDAATRQARQDALGEIQSLLAQAPNDPDLQKMLKADTDKLVSQLPPELRQSADDAMLCAAIEGDLESLIQDGADYLLARLHAEETNS